MIQTFTIKTIIILIILVALIVIVAYFLRKKLLEDDNPITISSKDSGKSVEDLRKQDLQDTIINIKNNTNYVPKEDEEEVLEEYSAKRIEDDEII